jgi:UDP-N-acetylglucosamine 2-epimerase (non-hydrolysing)
MAGELAPKKVLAVFGTRPEVVKLAPVLHRLDRVADTVHVASGQHVDLFFPLARELGLRIDHDLAVMRPDQTPEQVHAGVRRGLQAILARERPDLVLVQGDTSTALAAAQTAADSGVPIAHVEAGLRSGDATEPHPEELNRRAITGLASFHFAPTPGNAALLRAEGIAAERIFVTGNPIVDALHAALARPPGPALDEVLAATRGRKLVVLTTHRRESLASRLADNLLALRDFVRRHEDTALVFPVHPNPHVARTAADLLGAEPRVHLIAPLGYTDFVALLRSAWLIVSDSGGVQEEAPTLGRPVLVLRAQTERPEAVDCGVVRLVGRDHRRLPDLLEEARRPDSWANLTRPVENPFGRGDSGARIAAVIADLLRRGAPRAA